MVTLIFRTFALVLSFNLVLAFSPALAGDPTEIVKSTVDQVINILSNPAYKAPSQKSRRRALVKQVVSQHFDFEEMARRSLGAPWRNLSGSQRAEFVRLFSDLLESSYADKIERYTDEKVVYVGEHQDDDYAEVRSLVMRANDRIPLDYRLFLTSGGWKIYDVSIEGVSLVSNYRSQFSRIIHESSYGELVRRLRTKVSELNKIESM
jgi:phospholipid transport system substrate-binding protein